MKAPVNRNPRKVRHGSNTSRPNGASVSALSPDVQDLFIAALEGNRETRRLARRNLKKRLTADGVFTRRDSSKPLSKSGALR
jgi:hypothetical protein